MLVTVAYYSLPNTTRKSQSAGQYDNLKTAFIDNLAASTKHVAQTANVINYSSSKHSAGAVTITMNQNPAKISRRFRLCCLIIHPALIFT